MKKISVTILLLITFFIAHGQTSLSFQHLGNATFQNNLINPSLIPEGKFFLGLPVLSGIHVNVNNKLSYNQMFRNEGGQTTVDINKILNSLQRQNMVSSRVHANILHIGYRTNVGPMLSFTVNERIEADFLYPKELFEYVITEGNNAFLNDKVKFSNIGAVATHYREFGLGLAAPVNDQLTIGIRGKYLIGFANASTPSNFKATIESDGEAFQVSADWKNTALRTSGFDIYSGDEGDLESHLVMNGNKGFAVDLGGTYHLNRYYTITGSIVDIGFINWKEDIENHSLNDTTFTYNGVDLDNFDDIDQTLEDSLFSKFETTENSNPYRSWLPVTAHGSWIYHYSPQMDFYVTAGSRLIQRQLKMLYGGGVTYKFGRAFTASASATKLPQQFFNIGAALTAKGGPVQMYIAADQIINFSAPDAKAFDFRFGMSFNFGERRVKQEASGLSRAPIQGAKGINTNVFLGKKVKTKKRDGIYSIIKRQKRRDVRNKRTQRDNTVNKKSINGRTGKKNVDDNE
ncbi:hypothetical protein SAMN05421640_0057 [Ekhidna lutea]|uniref:DUF5723 domain-containing protein n=1 Tax=Ekhidna lutea TaxID=447679 RepID=A0A239EC12_EKHLU|nr:DUF5723 family protein [Ekhidna lutea]SNS41808.1 hypothetical protein SAMN05421640_0057 [Ekhidna lutea]